MITQRTLVERIKTKTESKFSFKGISVTIKDPLPKSINFKEVLRKVFRMLPEHLFIGIKGIKVGAFEQLRSRGFQGMYQNKIIYLTNEHKDGKSIIDDLIHEVSHSVEVKFKNIVYQDESLKKEFLEKRKALWYIMKNKGLSVDLEKFLEPKFSKSLDNLFYKEVGYPVLGIYTSNLFYSPYGCTSLREYFANGFEAFYMKEDVERLRRISPVLYSKIIKLNNLK